MYVFHDQMTKRSPVLIDPVTSPDGLWVDVDCSVGQDWASLESVNMGSPAGLKPGPEGLAVLAPVSETFEPLAAPGGGVQPSVEKEMDSIPF